MARPVPQGNSGGLRRRDVQRTWRERTLDGVVEDYRGWFGGFGGQDCYQDWAKIETDEALGAAAVLLGRRSDEWFAARWLSRTGEWADRLNSMPKYVVSSAVERARLEQLDRPEGRRRDRGRRR